MLWPLMAKNNFWIALVSEKTAREGSSSCRNKNKQQSSKSYPWNKCPAMCECYRPADVMCENKISLRQLLILCDGGLNMKKGNNHGEKTFYLIIVEGCRKQWYSDGYIFKGKPSGYLCLCLMKGFEDLFQSNFAECSVKVHFMRNFASRQWTLAVDHFKVCVSNKCVHFYLKFQII